MPTTMDQVAGPLTGRSSGTWLLAAACKAAIAGLVLGYVQSCMWGYFVVSQLM